MPPMQTQPARSLLGRPYSQDDVIVPRRRSQIEDPVRLVETDAKGGSFVPHPPGTPAHVPRMTVRDAPAKRGLRIVDTAQV